MPEILEQRGVTSRTDRASLARGALRRYRGPNPRSASFSKTRPRVLGHAVERRPRGQGTDADGAADRREELGRRVARGRARGHAARRLRVAVADELREPKVGDLGGEVAVEQDVARLEVVVEDALRVEVLEREGDLEQDRDARGVREPRARLRPRDDLCPGNPFNFAST